MIIYRIQDNDGSGPFKPGETMKWLRVFRDLRVFVPWPLEFRDITEEILDGFCVGCGCESKKVLKQWFSKAEYKTLVKMGYTAVEIVPDVIFGKSEIQCVFGTFEPLNKKVSKVFKLY